MKPGTTVPFARDGVARLPGGVWALTCRTVPSTACDAPLGGCHAHFTLALNEAEPIVRTWRPGDRIALPGLGGHKKLSDLFIDRKVPRAQRPMVPVLVAGDVVAWVVGHAVGEPYRATGVEPTVLCCTVMRDA
jgi:tRNA(Ile)-lysidine synthase